MGVHYKRKNKAKRADDVNPLRAGADLLVRELSDNPWQGTLTPRQKERWMFVKNKKGRNAGPWAVFPTPDPRGTFLRDSVANPGSSVWMERKARMNTAFQQGMHSCWQERWIHTKLSSITGIFVLFPRCGVRADMHPPEVWNASRFYYRFHVVLVSWAFKE